MNSRRFEPSLLLPWLLLLKLPRLTVLSHLTVSWSPCGRVSDNTEERWISGQLKLLFTYTVNIFPSKLSGLCKNYLGNTHNIHSSQLCCFPLVCSTEISRKKSGTSSVCPLFSSREIEYHVYFPSKRLRVANNCHWGIPIHLSYISPSFVYGVCPNILIKYQKMSFYLNGRDC